MQALQGTAKLAEVESCISVKPVRFWMRLRREDMLVCNRGTHCKQQASGLCLREIKTIGIKVWTKGVTFSRNTAKIRGTNGNDKSPSRVLSRVSIAEISKALDNN